jgi:hypothetical protein
MDAVIRNFTQPAAGVTDNRNRCSADTLCIFHRIDHISGITGSGDPDEDIGRRHFVSQGKAENLIIRNIVRHRHHGRDIVIQTFKMIFLLLVFTDAFIKIAAVVTGGCRAASIAADKNVPVGEPCFF